MLAKQKVPWRDKRKKYLKKLFRSKKGQKLADLSKIDTEDLCMLCLMKNYIQV